jgi:hypothetical protein
MDWWFTRKWLHSLFMSKHPFYAVSMSCCVLCMLDSHKLPSIRSDFRTGCINPPFHGCSFPRLLHSTTSPFHDFSIPCPAFHSYLIAPFHHSMTPPFRDFSIQCQLHSTTLSFRDFSIQCQLHSTTLPFRDFSGAPGRWPKHQPLLRISWIWSGRTTAPNLGWVRRLSGLVQT